MPNLFRFRERQSRGGRRDSRWGPEQENAFPVDVREDCRTPCNTTNITEKSSIHHSITVSYIPSNSTYSAANPPLVF